MSRCPRTDRILPAIRTAWEVEQARNRLKALLSWRSWHTNHVRATAEITWPVTRCGVDVSKIKANRKGSSSCKPLDTNSGQFPFRAQPNALYPGWRVSRFFSIPSDKYQGSTSTTANLSFPFVIHHSSYRQHRMVWVTAYRKMSHNIKVTLQRLLSADLVLAANQEPNWMAPWEEKVTWIIDLTAVRLQFCRHKKREVMARTPDACSLSG